MATTAEWNEAQRIRIAENHEIGTLNERHADIISNVHFLQARRRKLETFIEQWSSSPWTRRSGLEYSHVMKSRYQAEAEQLPGLKLQLSTAESRFEAAQREYAQLDEDALLVKLCDIRMKLALAEGRGKRIEEECRRIRLENQKIIEDQSSQRLIIDREGIDRNAHERRAADLLVECESLLESFRPSTARRYTFDDIESDRRLFRSAIDSAMIDIRRQYENLATTVTSEMKQWYEQKVSQFEHTQTVDISSQKERLALLRAELIDLRTKLNNLENRNRLLEALIADFEEAKAADLMSAESQLREDQVQLKNMMDQYDTITSGSPVPQTYTIASLRQEILRYRELLYGIGSGILSDGPTAAGALSIVHHRASSHDIGTGVSAYRGHQGQKYISGVAHTTQIRSTAIAQPQSGGSYSSSKQYRIGDGVATQSLIKSGNSATYSQIGSGVGQYSSQIGSGVGQYSSQIGSGVGEYSSQIGSGVGQYSSQIGSGVGQYSSKIGSGVGQYSSQIGSGVDQYSSQIGHGVATQDIGSGAVQQREKYTVSSATTTPTVISKLDYTIKDAADDLNTSRISSSEHDFAMHRSAQGNVSIAKVAADGSYITLENTSLDSDQDLGEWTLRSTSSTLKLVSYTFPRDFILTPQNTVQIYARGRGVHNPPHSLVCESDTTFATGDDLSVFLYDNNGQERAHLSQRSFFRSFSSF